MDQYNVQAAAGIALLGAIVAFGCGMGLWWLLGGSVKGSTPVATGRRWMNWVILLTSIAFLTKFFSQLFGGYGNPARALFEGVLGAIVLAAIAFAVGTLVARFRGGTNGGSAGAVPATPHIATPVPAPTTSRIGVSTGESTSHIMETTTSNFTPMSPQDSTVVDEDAIYVAIAKELETGATDKGIWTRLFAECDGDENRTKVAYIKKRAEKLKVLERARIAEIERQRDEEASKLQRLRLEIMASREKLSLSNITNEQAEKIHALGSTHTAAMFRNYVRGNNIAKAQELLTEMPLLIAHWEDSYGDTPLHLAVKNKHIEMTRLLLEYGAPTDQTNMDGHTPMDLARKTGNQQIIALLSVL